jgi:HSP20 family protein
MMAIIRWNPWNISSLLEDDFDFPTVPGVSRMLGQGLNIYESDDALVAEVALPGITEDKIDVSIDQRVVRVTATSEQTQEEKDKRKYFMSSMAQSYNYSFRLPDGVVDETEPKAELHNGVLTLSFKKAQPIAPKKIKVLPKTK